jgi:hypothetical protein
MTNIVKLRSLPIDLNSDVGHAFVVDATRAAEGLITDQELFGCHLSHSGA